MIKLELTTAVAIYTFITVIGVLLLWVSLRGTKGIKRYTPKEKYMWQCSVCTYNYVDSHHEVISKCPQCGSFNKRPAEAGREERDDNQNRYSSG